jgi:hypothetical protein
MKTNAMRPSGLDECSETPIRYLSDRQCEGIPRRGGSGEFRQSELFILFSTTFGRVDSGNPVVDLAGRSVALLVPQSQVFHG